MTYLEQYDGLKDDQAAQNELVSRWLRTEWRPFFRELREQRPVLRAPGFTLVSRFADVNEVLSRQRVFTVAPYAPRMDPAVDGPFMLSRDDTPTNWREKGIMQAMLRPEDLPAVRDLAGRFADEALDETAGRIDVVDQLGRYVPVRICQEHFGYSGADREAMYRWSRATQSDFFKNLQNDPAVHEASVRAGGEIREHLRSALEEKRAALAKDGDPPQDTLSRLLRTQLPAELGFDDHRVMANMTGLLVGSIETTSQAIVQVLEQLLQRPDVRVEAEVAARDDVERFDRYVWEALRFNPINPLLFRLCAADYTLAAGTPREQVIPAGTLVFALTASAMFDEDHVDDPDDFRTDRPQHLDLHFGYGHHTCLGRHIGGVVIPEVVRRVLLRPGVDLLPPPEGAVDFEEGPFPERFLIQLSPSDHRSQDAGSRPAGPVSQERR